MGKIPNSPLGRIYKEHMNMIVNKDINGLLNQYAEDALLISSFQRKPLYYKGHKEIKEHMQGILGIEGLESEIVFWAETSNPQTLMITEQISMKTSDGISKMRFADSWVLKDGKISVHFAGMVQYPDGTLA